MAFSAKFSDHLQSPTSPGFEGDMLSPRSTHSFGGVLFPPAHAAPTVAEHIPAMPRTNSIGTRRPSQSVVNKAVIIEEVDAADDKDELIRSLRLELEAERDLRRRVIDDYEVRSKPPVCHHNPFRPS